MNAPDIATSASYAGVKETDPAFKIEYEALKEWFEDEFKKITTEPKELSLAFLKNLKFNFRDEYGVKSIKDIDASVTFSDDKSRFEAWESIYDKYRDKTGDTEESKPRGIVVI